MVMDLQYGSTGKGLIVGKIAEDYRPDTIVTAWAPNAGHTYITSESLGKRKFVHTHLGNGIVSPNVQQVLLGPGSVINPEQLAAEIESCADLLGGVRILIHPCAAIATDRHIAEEAGPMTKIGSTKKGVGAAMIQRIRRDPDDMNIAGACDNAITRYVCSNDEYSDALERAQNILIEGAQGYGLSMYHGFYPYTTSRDVSVWQILADCGIGGSVVATPVEVIGTCRTFPIRVANRFDTEGAQVGYSGPCYPDQREISFEELGQATELTTVTKLPRRVFTFSDRQIYEAIRYNSVRTVFLNFLNYCRDEAEVRAVVNGVTATGAKIRWAGLGPSYDDVFEVASEESIVQLWRAYATGRIANTHG
jgi:adenylosuccinate synthase